MRFGSYRVFTFQLGSNNPTTLAASRQQGLVCLKSPGGWKVQIKPSIAQKLEQI